MAQTIYGLALLSASTVLCPSVLPSRGYSGIHHVLVLCISDVVFNPKYQILYADKESATDSFGIHCKKLLKKAKIDAGEITINSIPDVPILGF